MNASEINRELGEVLAEMTARWNRHDTKGYVAFWSEDCSFVNVVGMHRNGRRELLAEIDYLHAGRFRNSQIRIERYTVRPLSPDLAVVNAWWRMTGDPGMPGYPTQDGARRGVFTHVVRRTPEGWRFLASQNTDVLPLPDPIVSLLSQPDSEVIPA